MTSQPTAPPPSGLLASIGLDSRRSLAWALYDWANSAFATTILAAVFPIFYATVAARGLEGNDPTVAFAYTSALALLLTALIGPILGTIADIAAWKKGFLAVFTAVGVAGSAAMYFIGVGDWIYASVVFVIANIAFGAATIFYDSLLPHVTTRQTIDRVSTAGYALGYLGGGVLLVINLAWILAPGVFGFASAMDATRVALLSAAVWWAIFSIPLFRWVPEPPPSGGRVPANVVTAGFRQLLATFRQIRRYRPVLIFLIAFWLYNDGINTIIRMATIYGTEIGLGQTELIGALVLTQVLGIPCAFGFGPLAVRIGQKRAIYLALAVYTLISIGGFFMSTGWHFWVLAAAVALVQGGSQAISRSLFGTMIPRSRSSEFFGFFSVSSKFAGILGPLIFAVVGQLAGSSRMSVISLIVFFVGGMILLRFVDVDAGRRAAQEEDARIQASRAPLAARVAADVA